MVNRPYLFDPRYHHVIHCEPPFMGFLRREFPRFAKLMFLYRHMLNGNFVVAGWAGHDPRTIIDMLILGHEPALTRDHVAQFRLKWEPADDQVVSVERFDRVVASDQRSELRALDDEAREMLDLKRHAYKRYVRDGGSYWNDVKQHPLIPQPLGRS